MKYSSLVFLASFFFLLTSCVESVKEKPINTYFDVEALVDEQIEQLRQKDPLLAKQISIDGQSERDTINFDSLGWVNELEVFKLANINKPNLRGEYEAVEKTLDDSKIWSYTADKQSLGIEFLHVYFGSDSTLKKLEARYNEDNALYTSERNLEMAFENVDGKSTLSKYRIYGKQKMIMKDEVEFSIESEIL
ncbi:hypothetical protein GCM10011506_23150 [Marivirga lumbricoides]|uniref:LPS export ABC transporter periplasmic protein LptC n=1 Tax=Marivirga lumbricoides TaxID=1046115 RepID=A0ABQ1M9X9_9BACT|nr:hypothetical protein GCM10011506_23150 [Marivirga lumbricoides]